MTEPTRDEINRALAEWEGWTKGKWADLWIGPQGERKHGLIDYCSSLDAQMPLWDRLRAEGYIIALETGDGYVIVDVYSPLGRSVGSQPFRRDGTSVPEASARALYAVLEASR